MPVLTGELETFTSLFVLLSLNMTSNSDTFYQLSIQCCQYGVQMKFFYALTQPYLSQAIFLLCDPIREDTIAILNF